MSKKLFILFILAFFPSLFFADEAETATGVEAKTAPVVEPKTAAGVEAETAPVAKETQPFQPFAGRITGNKVRLRTAPHLDAPVIKELGNGEVFAITGEEKEYYIVTPSKEAKGYVFRTFILDDVVEGERVNVRLHPDTEAPIIGRLNSGDRINGKINADNNKWYEIELPATAHFYIAKEYVSNIGSVEIIAQLEEKRKEGSHHLNASLLFARAEMQKPFNEMDVEAVNQRFQSLVNDYADIPEIVAKAKEASSLVLETYNQKKSLLAEANAQTGKGLQLDQFQKLAQMGKELKKPTQKGDVAETAETSSAIVGLATVTDKMRVWQPLEESFYHLWAASHDEKSVEQFYEEEELNASVLTGLVEPYNKPVKNRPGDFLLKSENLPLAFLYSTKINLQEYVGKQVTIIATPRPNNNFAFPAYFVLSVE